MGNAFSLMTEIFIIAETWEDVSVRVSGEWECNQKLQEWRLKGADVESEAGKSGAGEEQNL